MSTLLELLVKELPVWPVGATYIVQDRDGGYWPSRGHPSDANIYNGAWGSDFICSKIKLSETATDHKTARITKGEWLEASLAVVVEPVDLPKLRLEVLALDTDIAQHREALGALLEKRRVAIQLIEREGFRILP